MKIQRLKEKDFNDVCKMVTERLLDSVEASFQLNEITDKYSLIYHFTHARISYWKNIGEVWIIGEIEGMLSGHFRKDESFINSLRLSLSMIKKVIKTLSKEDKKRLKSNLKESAGAENIKWRNKVCKRQNYYYIDLIAISHNLKGSGAFRKLMEPIIARMEQDNIPILLDTHDKNNVPIYEHFGFEIVDMHQSKFNHKLIQYSMIKRPNRHNIIRFH